MEVKSSSGVNWRLRRGMDRRFRSGHPWVYSNELMESPKGITPGALVQLQDAGGSFLAWGMGNPQSLISFRCLSRDSEKAHIDSIEEVSQTLIRAKKLRQASGLSHWSYRLCFGEADELPGLVIDRYRLEKSQVFVVQAHSAGADRICQNILKILEIYNDSTLKSQSAVSWDQTTVILKNDLSVRKLEGLQEEEPRVLKLASGTKEKDLQMAMIQVKSVSAISVSSAKDTPLLFQVDLLNGQKTGFFLDQFANIQMAALRMKDLRGNHMSKKIRILDLCSYVGQWGAQLSRVFKELGKEVEVVAVDASQQALDFAKRNIEAEGAHCEVLKADVLKDLGKLESQSFDLVISDPPALIKSRKDIPTGKHAYLQLMTQSIRLVKKGGGVVCCSCSGLLEEEAFSETLAKAAQRNHVRVSWIGRGCQSPDHPMLQEFPEGRYLKAWMGLVRE